MAVYCPECGGVMLYDPRERKYVCTSCGLCLSKAELERLRLRRERGEDERERLKGEYLDWWLKKK